MDTITARCGCPVPAVGAPNSSARRAAETRTCPAPRCRSGLPRKFGGDDCAAYCRLADAGVRFLVDHLTRRVYATAATRGTDVVHEFPTLPAAAAFLLD